MIQLTDFHFQANGTALEQELKKIENVTECKRVVNTLFERCLGAIRDSNQLRIANGLVVRITPSYRFLCLWPLFVPKTLCSISHHVLFVLKSNQNQYDALDILFDKHNCNAIIEVCIPVWFPPATDRCFRQELVESICGILFSDIHFGVKNIVLKLLLIFSTVGICLCLLVLFWIKLRLRRLTRKSTTTLSSNTSWLISSLTHSFTCSTANFKMAIGFCYCWSHS